MGIDNVADVSRRAQYVAANGQTVFPYAFPIFDEDDLVVQVDGATQTITTDYTVDGVEEDDGGNVTFVVAMSGGEIITIYSETSIQRISDFQLNGPNLSTVMNDELDRITIVQQELREAILRAIRFPMSSAMSASDMELSPISTWYDKYLFINSDGELEPAANLETTTLTQSIIGALLYPQTAAELAAGVSVVADHVPPGCVNRYANNTTPGTTDMKAAIDAAILQRLHGGENPYLLNQVYRTTAPIIISDTHEDLHFWGMPGAMLLADHAGDGIVYVVENENSEGNSIEGIHILGPNTLLPPAAYVEESVGAGICMNRNVSHTTGDYTNVGTESNAPPQYNGFLRNVRVEGFERGLDMQSVIGLNVWGCVFQFNQEGLRIDGGQCNANKFWGTHFRYNRRWAINSSGRTGGDLSNATRCAFYGCLIESNTPYEDGFLPGGNPPDDSMGIYLNNTYDFIFDGCYSENHAASIYLTNGSKGNQFIRHRIAIGGAGTRLDKIILDGAGIYSNTFDLQCSNSSAADVIVESNHANQLYNQFSGDGINFIAAEILAPLDFSNIRPNLNYIGSSGVGLIRRPSQGYKQDVSEGSTPGTITGIGTASATLYCFGMGEIQLDSGITGATTIDEFDGLSAGQVLILRNTQTSYAVTVKHMPGVVQLLGGRDNVMQTAHDTMTFVVGGNGILYEVGQRSKATTAYTRSATVVESRTLLANASATAENCNAVLAALIADLQAKGAIS